MTSADPVGATAVTVLVSPSSTSVSLPSTLPDASVPAVALAKPAASVAIATSSTATGTSFVPLMTIASVVKPDWPALSVTR